MRNPLKPCPQCKDLRSILHLNKKQWSRVCAKCGFAMSGESPEGCDKNWNYDRRKK